MQRSVVGMAVSVVLLGGQAAFALQPIPAYLKAHVDTLPEYKAFSEKLKALDSQCSVCHIPKADKKARGHGLNDFGKAVHDNFKHKAFTAADKAKGEAPLSDEAMKVFVSAWDKVQDMKNADGKTYGELMQAGNLPGKNPPPADAAPAK